jgi:YaiO family outer membrane protein
MRTAGYAGLVAGAVMLQGAAALAGEGSSLRGLKPPKSALEPEAYSGTTAGLRPRADEPLPDFSPRLFLSGGTYAARRVIAGDFDYRYSLHQPVGHNIAALTEPGLAGFGETVPRYTLHSQIVRLLPGGWGLGLGVRQSDYHFGPAHLLSFSAERTLGSFRGAYTLFSNRAEGATLGSAHRFEVSYLYGDRNTIGLAYTTGRDVENFSLPAAMVSSDVRDWTLSGRHWLSTNWAVTYDVLSQEQPLQRRQGLRLGVSRSF